MDFLILLFVGIGSVALLVAAFYAMIQAFVWVIEWLQFRALKRRSRRYNKGER